MKSRRKKTGEGTFQFRDFQDRAAAGHGRVSAHAYAISGILCATLFWANAARAARDLLPPPSHAGYASDAPSARAPSGVLTAPKITRAVAAPSGDVRAHGSGRPFSTVWIEQSGLKIGEAAVAADGRWRIDAPVKIIAAGAEVKVFARDPAARWPVPGQGTRLTFEMEGGDHFLSAIQVMKSRSQNVSSTVTRVANASLAQSDRGLVLAQANPEPAAPAADAVVPPVKRERPKTPETTAAPAEAPAAAQPAPAAAEQAAPAAPAEPPPAKPAVAPEKPAPAPQQQAKPKPAQEPSGSAGVMSRVQDWLARANREYQNVIVKELSRPSGDSDATAKAAAAKLAAEKAAANKAAAEQQAADAKRKNEDQRKKAEAAAKQDEAKKAEAQAEAAKKAQADTEKSKRAEAENAKRAQAELEAKKAAEAEAARTTEAAKDQEAERLRAANEAARAAEEKKRADQQRAEEQRQREAARQAEIARQAAEAKSRAAEERAAEAPQTPRAAPPSPAPVEDSSRHRRLTITINPEPIARPRAEQPGSDVAAAREDRAGEVLIARGDTRYEPDRPERARKIVFYPGGEYRRGTAVKRWLYRSKVCSSAGRKSFAPKRYVVARGDSLWRISSRHYNAGRHYGRIYRANRDRISDPDLIYPCQRFLVPRRRA